MNLYELNSQDSAFFVQACFSPKKPTRLGANYFRKAPFSNLLPQICGSRSGWAAHRKNENAISSDKS
jgi:hypothetical protein